MPGKQREEADPLVAELRQIRGLLTLFLLKAGASSQEIATAIGAGASTIRRDFPAGRFAPFGETKKRGAKR